MKEWWLEMEKKGGGGGGRRKGTKEKEGRKGRKERKKRRKKLGCISGAKHNLSFYKISRDLKTPIGSLYMR